MQLKLNLTTLLALFGLSVYAQQEPTDWGYKLGEKSKWFINFNILTPTGGLFFDIGKDALPDTAGSAVEPDFFKDGSGNFNLQLASADLFHGTGKVRGGINLGLGIAPSKAETNETGYLILNTGLALSINQLFRFEIGLTTGFSAKESYKTNYDSAIYVGISLPTHLSEKLKGLIK